MTLAYVGLGSNLEDPRRQLQAAITALGGLPETRLARTSAFYRSSPIGNPDQPDFLNAVAALHTRLAPGVLLEGLLGIERRQGRERPFPNAPRTLDLDLLLFGDEVIRKPGFSVPHPRMHQRAFVLRPLLELDPGIAIPGIGPAAALLAACADQPIERMP